MHLVFCISSHGFGHLSQSAPIIAALRARFPGLRVTVRTGLPEIMVRQRLGDDVTVLGNPTDFGFEMHDALTIDDTASLARYAALHADVDAWQARERRLLQALGADVVFTNIGYAPLEAAAALGIPAFGACSLNWASLLEQLYPAHPDVKPIATAMRNAYAQATALFEIAPGMPFDRFDNVVPIEPIEPIGRIGTERRDELRRILGVGAPTRLLLIAFGGLSLPLDTAEWRLPDGWVVLAFAEGVAESARVRDAAALGWPFIDLLASCDVLVAKPGYGTVTEAAFSRRPTLLVARDGWPEAPHLAGWLARHVRCEALALDRLRRGDFADALERLAAQPERPQAAGDGAGQIAREVARRLESGPSRARTR
jgi:hypothetical protein